MKAVLMLQLWYPPPRFHALSPPSLSSPHPLSISATSSTSQQQDLLTAKERRRLRNERRESNNTTSWREEVEDKLIKKKKKELKSWRDELNLDNLIKLGPQWWILRVQRVKAQYTSEALARSLSKLFPDTDFKFLNMEDNLEKLSRLPTFSNLLYFEVHIPDNWDWNMLVSFLRNAPKLKSLVIEKNVRLNRMEIRVGLYQPKFQHVFRRVLLHLNLEELKT